MCICMYVIMCFLLCVCMYVILCLLLCRDSTVDSVLGEGSQKMLDRLDTGGGDPLGMPTITIATDTGPVSS